MEDKVTISTEEYKELVRLSATCGTLLKRIGQLSKYIQKKTDGRYTMIEAEVCGAILGFEVPDGED